MRVVLVPSTLALLPDYTSLEDPVADLRKGVEDAVDWLLEDGPAAVRGATPSAKRIGNELLGDFRGSGPGLLVVANGSATRTERAPGHLDERAEAFDASIGAALAAGRLADLATIDLDLAGELWAPDAPALASLASFEVTTTEVTYDDAPYGVQYWVVRWVCES